MGCRIETVEVMYHALAPGVYLNRTTQDMLESISRLLASVYTISDDERLDVSSWGRKLVTRTSTMANDGVSKNPLQNLAVENGFL